jgi:AraC family transcriptional activator of pobA
VSRAEIPRFFLYGEPPQHVADRFLHLESLDVRSRPANWNVRPHTHGGLSHIFCLEEGEGAMSADGRSLPFRAPCLLVIPVGVVHGFSFSANSRGAVLTISEAYLDNLVQREPQLAAVFVKADVLGDLHGGNVFDAFERLRQELAWSAPGHHVAVEALLLTVLVEALRLTHYADDAPKRAGRQAALVARFRDRVEQSYRSETKVEAYAEALKVSPKQLRAACVSVAGAPPIRIIQDRLLLEAKRLMLYSNMTVAEAAYYLGFEDPAYFSRFFTRGCRVSPRRFRQIGGEEGATPGRAH